MEQTAAEPGVPEQAEHRARSKQGGGKEDRQGSQQKQQQRRQDGREEAAKLDGKEEARVLNGAEAMEKRAKGRAGRQQSRGGGEGVRAIHRESVHPRQ